MPYYRNPNMLHEQIKWWDKYSDYCKQNSNIILVDDGSPKETAIDVIRKYPMNINFKLYKIKEDIKWNQHGARNLAFCHADEGFVFATDIDHVLPDDQLEKLINSKFSENNHYKFARKDYPSYNDYKHHANTFLCTREAFINVGGYDEDYCGTYGGDGPLHRALQEKYPRKDIKDIYVLRYGSEVIEDCSTWRLLVNVPKNSKGYKKIYNAVKEDEKLAYRKIMDNKCSENRVSKKQLRFSRELQYVSKFNA